MMPDPPGPLPTNPHHTDERALLEVMEPWPSNAEAVKGQTPPARAGGGGLPCVGGTTSGAQCRILEVGGVTRRGHVTPYPKESAWMPGLSGADRWPLRRRSDCWSSTA
ncbi:MAG: hypothetical protein KIT69_03260 [Propionibacteriaceae bacterium]|nr:hypothetical protein [Propionibacteriaceae bacterium]